MLMAHAEDRPQPSLSAAELEALRDLRAHPAVNARAGRQIADALRKDFPEFGDITLGRLALRFSAYLSVAACSLPGVTADTMSGVIASAASELTSLETGNDPAL